MTGTSLKRTVYRHADLAPRAVLDFDLTPARDECDALARALDLVGLRKLRFRGRIAPEGQRDWHLEADLGATVVQPCVVTLGPVTTRLDTPVTRRFVAGMPVSEAAPGEEAAMPDDDTAEPLGRDIDLTRVMIEALALALPEYPRARDAELQQSVFAPAGTDPLTQDGTRPFAGLADLKRKLDKDG